MFILWIWKTALWLEYPRHPGFMYVRSTQIWQYSTESNQADDAQLFVGLEASDTAKYSELMWEPIADYDCKNITVKT